MPDEFHVKEIIPLSDEVDLVTDVAEFYSEVEILLNTYGMGGCRSFSEYVNMVNNEDPAVIDSLLMALVYRKQIEEEHIKNAGKSDNNAHDNSSSSHSRVNRSTRNNKETPIDDFLINAMGVSIKDIRKAKENVRENKALQKDFSHVNSKSLASMSEKEFKALMKDMDEYQKHTQRYSMKFSDIVNGENKAKAR